MACGWGATGRGESETAPETDTPTGRLIEMRQQIKPKAERERGSGRTCARRNMSDGALPASTPTRSVGFRLRVFSIYILFFIFIYS